MNEELFDAVRRLELPASDYAIFGSGPLAIRGIIAECSDLDVLCRGEAWDAVQSKGRKEFLPEYGVSVVTMSAIAGSDVTFGTEWGIGNFDVDKLIDTAEIIDRIPFVRLEHVVRYKTIRSSAKDLRHLKWLEESGYSTRR